MFNREEARARIKDVARELSVISAKLRNVYMNIPKDETQELATTAKYLETMITYLSNTALNVCIAEQHQGIKMTGVVKKWSLNELLGEEERMNDNEG